MMVTKEKVLPADAMPTASPLTKRSNHVDLLLVLRAYACFLVVANHSYGEINHAKYSTVFIFRGMNLSWLLYAPSYAGVWIFFTLSGYLMGKGFYSGRYPLTWSGIIAFFRNRALRICPLYYFNILFICTLLYPDMLRANNLANLCSMLLFRYNGESLISPNPNVALWSISTEVQFYLLVPLAACLFIPRIQRIRHAIGMIGLVVIVVFLGRLIAWQNCEMDLQKYDITIYKPIQYNLDLFLIGFLVNPLVQLIKRSQFSFQRNVPGVLWIVIGMLFYFSAAYLSFQAQVVRDPLFLQLFIFVLPVLTALFSAKVITSIECWRHQPIIPGNLHLWRLVKYFGLLTYGIYLWHLEILHKVSPLFHFNSLPLDIVCTFAFGSTLAVTCAAITYYAIEKPFEQFKRLLLKQGNGAGFVEG